MKNGFLEDLLIWNKKEVLVIGGIIVFVLMAIFSYSYIKDREAGRLECLKRISYLNSDRGYVLQIRNSESKRFGSQNEALEFCIMSPSDEYVSPLTRLMLFFEILVEDFSILITFDSDSVNNKHLNNANKYLENTDNLDYEQMLTFYNEDLDLVIGQAEKLVDLQKKQDLYLLIIFDILKKNQLVHSNLNGVSSQHREFYKTVISHNIWKLQSISDSLVQINDAFDIFDAMKKKSLGFRISNEHVRSRLDLFFWDTVDANLPEDFNWFVVNSHKVRFGLLDNKISPTP